MNETHGKEYLSGNSDISQIVSKNTSIEDCKNKLYSNPISYQLAWKISLSVPLVQQESALKWLTPPGLFGPVDLYSELITKMNDEEMNGGLTKEQSRSLRFWALSQQACFNAEKIQQKCKEISSHYDDGDSCVGLSAFYDGPPCLIFRVVLRGRGWSKDKIKKRMKLRLFNSRDLFELTRAEQYDVIARSIPGRVEAAKEFELKVAAYFKSHGISFRTEEMLSEEQAEISQLYGNCSWKSTPDFLFNTPITINSHRCNWLECKNFFLCDLKLNLRKIKRQVRPYVTTWGSGIICTRLGYVTSILGKLGDGVHVVDATTILETISKQMQLDSTREIKVKSDPDALDSKRKRGIEVKSDPDALDSKRKIEVKSDPDALDSKRKREIEVKSDPDEE